MGAPAPGDYDSRLLLKSGQYSDATFRERIWSDFEAAGIERQRVMLVPENHAAFLDTYNRIDIALDPWPYSGGLTTCARSSDLDGVLTDGRLYYGPDGEALKVFNTQDGHGLKKLAASGVTLALITGRDTPMVARRAAELGIQHVPWRGP